MLKKHDLTLKYRRVRRSDTPVNEVLEKIKIEACKGGVSVMFYLPFYRLQG